MVSTVSNSLLQPLSHRITLWPERRSLALLIFFLLAVAASAQNTPSVDGYNRLNPDGLKQIDEITEALHKGGKICLIVGLSLLSLVVLKKMAPIGLLDKIQENRLSDAVESIGPLLEHIRTEAEAASGEPEEQTEDEGILAGMVTMNEMTEEEDVPSYVLTVNDLTLDKVQTVLSRLRRLRMPKAVRYRNYMFTILDGIKRITEQCETAGAASSLAVNAREYFGNERRHHLWKTLLTAYAKRGEHREEARVFLLFMKNLRSHKPMTVTPDAPIPRQDVTAMAADKTPDIPEMLVEEALPRIQKAAVEEAKHLVDFIQTEQTPDRSRAWQFELVRRQQKFHLKDDARKILRLFLRHEIEAVQTIIKNKMLPCRSWDHILYMLGVESAEQLHERVEMKLLTGQEIIILEKAFLQTFAKREVLQKLYGHDANAGVIMDLHMPEIQTETLSLLRQTHETEAQDLDLATEFLDEHETPQRHEVTRLIKHFVHHGHLPHNLDAK